MTSTEAQVNEVVTGIEQAAKDTGTSSQKMLDEVNKQLTDKGITNDSSALKAVVQKLEEDKVLPRLILVEFDNDAALQEFGDGKKFDVAKLKSAADGQSANDSPAERLLAQAFLDKLSAIDKVGNADGQVTKDELEAWSKNEATKPGLLSPEAIDKTATALHEAINRKGFAWSNDPDKETIDRLLDPLNAADRAALESRYHQMFDPKGGADTLRRELKDKLGGDKSVDWRRVEAVLDRTDGKTNDAGAVMVALTEMNSDRNRGNTMLRNILETLNEKDIAQLDKDFKAHYGKSYLDAINENKNLSPETKEALPILLKGVDHRTADDLVALANIAVKYHNLELFGESVRGDGAEAKQARQKLQSDNQFLKDFVKAFPSELQKSDQTGRLTFDQSVDQVALDYLKEGHISLATLTANNTNRLFADNKENVSLALRNATPTEQTDFIAGKEFALSNTQALNAEQKRQLDYYNKIHGAFKSGANDREVAMWEDLLEHGEETIISQMAQAHNDGKIFGIGASTNKETLFSAVENLSEADWQRLKGIKPPDPKVAALFRQEIERSLDTYASAEEKDRVLKLIDKKIAKTTYDEANAVKRTLTETIDDNTGSVIFGLGTSYNHKNIVDQIVHMSPEEAARYYSDSCYRNQIDDFVNKHLDDTEKLLVHHLLVQVNKDGTQVKTLSPSDQVLLDIIDGASDSDKLKHAEVALQDKELRDRLSKTADQLSTEDRQLRQAFTSVLENAYLKAHPGASTTPDLNPDYKAYSDNLFQNGVLSLSLKLELNFPKADLIVDMAKASEKERNELRVHLNAQEQEVLDAVLADQKHELTIADKMRLFVIGDGGSYEDFKDELEKYHKDKNFAAIQDIENEYTKKYHSNLNNDFIAKVADKDKSLYTDLLTPANGDGKQNFYDNLTAYLEKSGISIDGSGQTNQRAIDQFASTLQEYQKVYQTLPRETQEALDKYFNDSLDQYKASKEKLSELASTALITAAALATVIATGGTATPLVMAAAFAAGGITKNLLAAGIEGSDFQLTAENIAKNFLSGGFTAASNFFGGEAFGFGKTLGTVGESVAGDVIKTVGTKTLKEGADEIIAETVPQLIQSGAAKVSESDLVLLVDRVAAPGATQADKDLIKQAIQAGIGKQADTIDGLVNNSALQQVIKGAIESGVTGGAVNVASTAFDDVLNGQPINIQNLLVSGLTGVAMGAGIHLGFSGLKGAKDYFAVKKGVSPNGAPEIVATPENGDFQYVKRGNEVYKLDGSKGDTMVLEDGDIPLHDVPQGQAFAALPPGRSVQDFEIASTGASAPGDNLGFWQRLKNNITSKFKDVWNFITPQVPKFKAPEDVAIVLDGRDYQFDANGELKIGRDKNSALSGYSKVSREQGTLKYQDGKMYFTDNGSTNGTYLQRSGSTEYERLPVNQPVEIGPNDVLRFGGSTDFDPKLELFKTTGPVSFDVSINGQSIPVGSNGRVYVGLDYPGLKGEARDFLDHTVSHNHGSLQYDFAAQKYAFTDNNSGNGTFIKHEDGSWTEIYKGQISKRAAGSDKWVPVQQGSTVNVASTDEIHLGTEGGPQVLVYKTQGRTLTDGSTLYRKPDGDTIVRPDGSSASRNNVGEQVFKDPDGRVLHSDSPKGRSIDFAYTAKGELSNVRFADAQGNNYSYYTQDGVNWSTFYPDPSQPGQYKTEAFPGRVEAQMDGSVKLIPADSNKPTEILNVDGSRERVYKNGYHEYQPSDYYTEKSNLKAIADHSFTDVAQRNRFLNYAEAFESRALRDGLTHEEIAAVYQQIDRLMEGGPNAFLSAAERTKLAEQLMYNSAYPRTIDQGANNTCNVTTIEARVFSKHPEDAAKMVTDVALTGKYTMPDGSVVDVGRVKGADFIPDDNENGGVLAYAFDRNSNSKFPPDVKIDKKRNWVDEIFQNTAVNINYAHADMYYRVIEIKGQPDQYIPTKLQPGEVVQYVKTKPTKGNPSTDNPTGEKLVVYSSQGNVIADNVVAQQPGVDTDSLQDIYNAIVPSHGSDGSIQPGTDSGFIIASDGVQKSLRQPGNVVGVRDKAEFEKALLKMQADKKFPAVMWVDTNKNPKFFKTAPSQGHASHVIVIEDIREVNGQYFVDISNQWGSASNEDSVPIDVLYGVIY